jgi:heptosyltransferase-2
MAELRDRFSQARLTLMTGTPYAALARLCPSLDDVIAVDRHAMRDGPKLRAVRDIRALIHTIRSRHFDLVIDFHSFRETNLLTWLSGAPHRLGMKRSYRSYLSFCFNVDPVLEDKSLHVAEMFRSVAGAAPGADLHERPRSGRSIVIPEDIRTRVRHRYVSESGGGAIVVVYAGASVSSRRWPPERFAAIADHAASAWGATVLILSGMSTLEQAIGREIDTFIKRSDRVQFVVGLDILDLAAVIGLASLLVSNDSGPMHIGPALDVPTLGIFSRSLPTHYRPTGSGDRYVKKERVEEVTAAEVIDVMDQMWAVGRPVT